MQNQGQISAVPPNQVGNTQGVSVYRSATTKALIVWDIFRLPEHLFANHLRAALGLNLVKTRMRSDEVFPNRLENLMSAPEICRRTSGMQVCRSYLTVITGAFYVLVGMPLIAGGVWLLSLGGSPFYIVAGIGILCTGSLLIVRHILALPIFAAVIIGATGWAIWEVGFDWWPLVARLDIFYLLALWLLPPWLSQTLKPTARFSTKRGVLALWGATIATTAILVVGMFSNYHDLHGAIAPNNDRRSLSQSAGLANEDWSAYGRTQFGQRYSPLQEITPGNVSSLKVAWIFRTHDLPGPNDPGETTFEVTPIKIRNTLYLCSPHQRLFALDAKTGRFLWSFDPKIRDDSTFQHLTCRGVSYHESGDGVVARDGTAMPTDCPRKIFLPVNDGRMISVNADSGTPCKSFAENGTLNLQGGMGIKINGFYEPTSPPVVSDRIIVVSGSVTDNYSTQEPSGVVRGFDVNTGRLVWSWDSGNLDENALPSATHQFTNNSPNSWMTASYDARLGLIYLPMGVGTPDIWGGGRTPAAERYSSALVALNINTGKLVWSYQTVHHDLWDMDLPAQPTLVDLKTSGGNIPAVLQPAKTGDVFVLDRRDGKRIVPAVERAVPQGAAPGDRVSPTQPFSNLSFRPKKPLTGADMWGVTIFDQLACRIKFHKLRYEGIFTPPSLRGTLVFPGNLGMFEWGGLAVDPDRQIAVANPIVMPFVSTLLPRGPNNPSAPNHDHPPGSEIGVQPMYGTPYGAVLKPLLSPLGLPCNSPPWGYIAGIDLKTLKIAWMHPNGTVRDSAPIPIPLKLGVPSLGGPMVTAGGLAFLTSTLDYYIRAYNILDGALIWQDRLPAGGQSTPMSYAVDGKQYILTAAGGHRSLGTKIGDYVIAYSLSH